MSAHGPRSVPLDVLFETYRPQRNLRIAFIDQSLFALCAALFSQ